MYRSNLYAALLYQFSLRTSTFNTMNATVPNCTTICNCIEDDPLKAMIDPWLWTSWFITLTLGNSFLVALVHYEWFGGDPQKRSLQNQLVSEVTMAGLLSLNTFHLQFLALELNLIGPFILELTMKIHRGCILAGVAFTVLHTTTGTTLLDLIKNNFSCIQSTQL